MMDQRVNGLVVDPEISLTKKVSKGVLWVTAAIILARGLNVVSAVILARLLAPDDFGLLAIAMAIVAFSLGITDIGFESALIQKQNKPEDFLNATWTFGLVRYLILFVIVYFAAPLFASYFKEPKAVAIVRVISVTLVFLGLRNIGVVNFRKNLDFKKQFVLEGLPLLVNVCVVIALALILKNVWALVWASLFSSMVACCLSYILHSYRPKLDFNINKAGNLFKFGKWILGASIINMVMDQGMTMFMGKFLGLTLLGFFNRAGVFSTMGLQQLTEIVWKVGYPTYSKLQHQPEKIKQAYLKTLQLLTFVGMPMAGGIFILSRDFVHLFLTDKWLPIVPLMQIFCLQSILLFINTPADITFQAVGQPAIGVKISTLGVMVLAFSVYPLTRYWGATGAVASLFLNTLVTAPMGWYISMKLVNFSLREFLKPVALSFFSTVIMVAVITGMKECIAVPMGMIDLGWLVLGGMIVYFSATLLFDRFMNYGMCRLLREMIAGLRQA